MNLETRVIQQNICQKKKYFLHFSDPFLAFFQTFIAPKLLS